MLRTEREARTIEISKNHEYFFAICARGKHSFVMIGVKDNDTQEFYHLFSVGKFFVMNNSTPRQLYLKMLFSSAPSRLRMETLFYKENDIIGEFEEITDVFSYKSYVFSEEQYLRFLQHVSDCHARTKHIYAYQKYVESNENTDKTTFKYLPIPASTGQEVVFDENASFNSAENSCRSTAIEMTKDATSMSTNDDSISTTFLSALPYIGCINNGKLNRDFLVFPMPPEQNNLSANVYSMLKIVYKHLETIPKKFAENHHTYAKFNAVKRLHTLLDANKSQDIFTLSDTVRGWENDHRDLIDIQRGFSMYSRTATRQMLSNLETFLIRISRTQQCLTSQTSHKLQC